jgi:hypothetical protein
MRRLAYAFLLAILATGLVAAPATAESTSARPQNLGALLGELWTTVLELPAPENPYNGGDGCIKLQGNVVAPFSGSGVASCTVQPGTRILFSGWTSECSTFEGNGTTERQLRKCARDTDAVISSSVTINGASIRLRSVETKLLRISLPVDNIFEVLFPDQDFELEGLSVAHGYEYLTRPLKSGSLHIVNNVRFGDDSIKQFTTDIIVQ